MPRHHRPHLPGVPFHITARIQCREKLFAGIEQTVAAMIREAGNRSDAGLIAYAVMPNHLHVVLQQGAQPLASYMQPLLRRVALLVRRTHDWEGHVFERRYRESACLTADYFRNAIAYVHLNAVRASLATTAGEYRWCSERAFCASEADRPRNRIAMEDALRVFARDDQDSLLQCAANYSAFVAWRTTMDARAAIPDSHGWHTPAPPVMSAGDDHWSRRYAPFVRGEVERRMTATRRMDLRDLAKIVMREIDPAMTLDDLRQGLSTRVACDVRERVVQRAVAVGYTGRALSSFLRVSPATISRLRAGL